MFWEFGGFGFSWSRTSRVWGFDSTPKAWYPPKLEPADGLHHETDSLRKRAADTPLPNKSHPSSLSRAHVRLHRWND